VNRSMSLFPIATLLAVACTAELPQVSVTPEAPITTDTLRLDVADGATVSVSWLRDGEELAELRDSLEVSPEWTARDQSWSARVWAGSDVDRTEDEYTQVDFEIANAAPSVTSAAIVPDEPSTDEDLVIQVEGADPDGDTLLWRVEWDKNGEHIKELAGEVIPSDLTARGEVWTARVWVSDGDIEVGPVDSEVMIDNKAPVATQVRLAPAEAYETTELVATPTGTDSDEDALTWSYTWYVDGVQVDGATGSTLDGAAFDRGQQVEVEATPNDGFVDGSSVRSAAITILNSAPTATGATISPASPSETDTLTCAGQGFADVDGDAEGWTYAWSVNGTVVASGPTLDGASFDRDDVIGCIVEPTDGDRMGEAVTAASVTVRNTAPVLDGISLDPGVATTTDAVSVALGTLSDVDDDTVTVEYAWTVDGSAAGSDATLPASAFSRDQVVSVTVTPTDGTDAGVPSSASLTVQNSAPVVSSISLSPASPGTDDDIVATTAATDADDDSISLTYAWTVDGSPVVGETGDTLPSSAFAKGQAIVATVTPDDGTDTGTAVASAAVTAVNTPPVLDSAAIDPGTLREGDTATCVPGDYMDADGDTVSFTYAWSVDGADVGVTTATLSSSYFSRDEAVSCTLTPTDGTEAGESFTATAVEVDNTAPSVAGVSLSSLTPATDDDIVATAAGVTDVDGDTVELTWSWTVDGSEVRSVTGTALTDTLPASSFGRGDAVQVSVTPADDADAGTTVLSASATVQNTAPVVSAISLAPTSPSTSDAVVATTTATDLDGDSISLTYAWTVDGSPVVGVTGDTLPSSAFTKGQAIVATVTPDDGTDSGTPVASAAITAVNTAPVLDSAAIDPGTLRAGDTATCVPGDYMDADDDTVSFTYAWTVDGSSVGVTTATLAGSYFSRGEAVRCTLTPTDGSESGESYTSAAVVIDNTAPSLSGVSLSTTTPETRDDVTATASGISDVDGDTVELTWSWTVNGSEVRSVTGTALTDTLDASNYSKGDTIKVAVTPSDDADSGVAVESTVATVQNNVPFLESASLTPVSPDTTTDVTATWDVYDDDAGDTLTPTLTWYVQDEGAGAFVKLSETSDTLSASEFDKDDVIKVEVVISDGTDSSAMRSSTRTVDNAEPTPPTSVALTPASPTPTTTLTCTATGATDPDGDSLSYYYTWYRNGSYVMRSAPSVSSTYTLTSSETDPGDTWTCRAATTDGGYSSSSVDATTTVGLASDCDELYGWGYTTDGEYEVDTPTGGEMTVYCDMRSDGGWTEIVDEDYGVYGCPGGWVDSSQYGGSCIIDGPAVRQATFDNHGIAYDGIRIDVGLSQFASMDGFGGTRTGSLTAAYGDGFALLYDDGGWRDVHTWLLATSTSSCGAYAPPMPLYGSYSCTSTFGSSSWTATWASGLDFDGFSQFSLPSTTTVPPVGQIMADQDTTDEDLAVRHLTIFIK